MKENYYLYLLQDDTTPSSHEDSLKIIDLIPKYETSEVNAKWGTSRALHRRISHRILWTHHISVEPQDLGKLVSDLTDLKSVRVGISRIKHTSEQEDHLLQTPAEYKFIEED